MFDEDENVKISNLNDIVPDSPRNKEEAKA